MRKRVYKKEGTKMSEFKPKVITTLKGYTKKQFINDLTAGIVVSIIALPLSIALAIASGVSPEKGLHTAIIAGFIISALGGSRVLIGGPTGAFMVIVFGIVTKHGIEGLVIATFLAGLIMIFMGICRLGSVIKYIPYPITSGFTSGIAVVIFSSQIKDFFGLKIEEIPANFIGKWTVYFKSLHLINMESMMIGILAIILIIGTPKFSKKIPGTLIALIVTSIIVIVLDLNVATVGSKYKDLSSGMPSFNIPKLNIGTIKILVGPAMAIAILGSIESLLCAVASDAMIGAKHRSNMELVGQGVANMASALFGGIPATGAIARTAANVNNGGRTPISGIVHAISLLLIMLVFIPYAKVIPLSALAAVLIIVAYNMGEWREFKHMLNLSKSDFSLLFITFSVTVLWDLIKAIEIGVVVAAFLFMKRMIDVSTFDLCSLDKDSNQVQDFKIQENTLLKEHIKIYELNGPFFFGVTDSFLEKSLNMDLNTKILIIRMRKVPTIDATALYALKRVITECHKQHLEIFITEINEQPKKVFVKSGIIDLLGEKYLFKDFNSIVNYLSKREVKKAI